MSNLLRFASNSAIKKPFSIIKTINAAYVRRISNEVNLNINTNVPKDVILFKYDNPRFFRILNIFAIAQFAFWGYVSYSAFFELKNVPVSRISDDTPWWRKINLGDSKYRYSLGTAAFIIGYGILATSWVFTLKSVRYLVLRKGGQQISFVTYTPFGDNRITTASLSQISAKGARTVAKSQLPIKLKDTYFHYILDMRGEFKNTALFDQTAGIRRTWRT